MTQLSWRADFELGVGRMDDTHREFVDLVNRLESADDAGFMARLDALIEHTVGHFAQENAWMERSAFGPLCHIAEHQQVLDVLAHIRAKVAQGDLALGRRLPGELATWFSHHAATMDSMLVSHMARVGFDPDAAETEVTAEA